MRHNFRLSTPPIFRGILCDLLCPFSADFACPPGLFRALATARDLWVAARVFILLMVASENIYY